MITYVNTVLVSSLATGSVLSAAPAAATSMSTPSADAGKFIIANCDNTVADGQIYNVTTANADTIKSIKVGIVTKKNAVLRKQDGTVEYTPIIKWSNVIKADDVKSFNTLTYTDDTEDLVTIDFNNLDADLEKKFAEGGKRIIVRLTFKDLPTRFRKWTESYEYLTKLGDTKTTIAEGIAALINKEWKRARVSAKANSGKVEIEALPYDDDDANKTLNWAAKVRFNANVYYTDPGADGWESLNKYFPLGVTIEKVPGTQYAASAKLVRDRENQGLGYEGILNRGEGTWPIIEPAAEVDITAKYDAITLEFENMYRTADDLFRKTKQTVEVYGITGQLADLQSILETFVTGETA